jgi:hypothetical protein
LRNLQIDARVAVLRRQIVVLLRFARGRLHDEIGIELARCSSDVHRGTRSEIEGVLIGELARLKSAVALREAAGHRLRRARCRAAYLGLLPTAGRAPCDLRGALIRQNFEYVGTGFTGAIARHEDSIHSVVGQLERER